MRKTSFLKETKVISLSIAKRKYNEYSVLYNKYLLINICFLEIIYDFRLINKEKLTLPLNHDNLDLWNNLTQRTIQSHKRITVGIDKTNSNKLDSKHKSICLKKTNKNMFDENIKQEENREKKKIEIEEEMNAINNVLSVMLQKYPNLVRYAYKIIIVLHIFN